MSPPEALPLFVALPPGADEPLTVEQRSCLLRAGRRGLLGLEDELARHRNLDARYAAAVIEATQMEIDCLQGAIAWLWRQAL